jgi:hypothetical protein
MLSTALYTAGFAGSLKAHEPFRVPNPVNPNGVPVIPNQYYAEISGNTTGNVSGVPTGVFTMTEYYDYDNKRRRIDRDDGVTKMYDYKTMVDPCPVGDCPGKPKFPSPQGFRYQTNDIEHTCCFVWLVDSDTGEPETMDKFEVESNAKLVGTDARGDHWLSVTKFPFLQTDDWWFKEGVVQASNSYFKIPGHSSVSGYTMSNTTYTKFNGSTLDPSVFDHPDSRPTFGKCKECGVDTECPMWQCMQ